jgi:hypothetical protein
MLVTLIFRGWRVLHVGLRVPPFVLRRQHRGALLFYPALGANDSNQVAAAQLKLMRLAKRVQLFQVLAGHGLEADFVQKQKYDEKPRPRQPRFAGGIKPEWPWPYNNATKSMAEVVSQCILRKDAKPLRRQEGDVMNVHARRGSVEKSAPILVSWRLCGFASWRESPLEKRSSTTQRLGANGVTVFVSAATRHCRPTVNGETVNDEGGCLVAFDADHPLSDRIDGFACVGCQRR